MTQVVEIIKAGALPLTPVPTKTLPVLNELTGIRAVLFDVYGTLLISGSGDIGAHSTELHQKRLDEAWGAVGLADFLPVSIERFRSAVKRSHESSRIQGIAFPEIEVREIWRVVLSDYQATLSSGLRTEFINRTQDPSFIEALSVEFEVRTNPVWPMPGAIEFMKRLATSRISMGLISNAQFYTPLALELLFNGSLKDLGLESSLLHYSYVTGHAKPDARLYLDAVAALRKLQIEPHEVLYLGNDMRNDIAPASRVGFRTGLFAGDSRSLRLREGDPLVEGVKPDVVLTAWDQLAACLKYTNLS